MLSARRCAKCFTHMRSFNPHTGGVDTFVPFDIGWHLSIEVVISCSRSHSQPGQEPSMAEGRLLEQAAGAAPIWAIPCKPPGWSQEGCADLRDGSVKWIHVSDSYKPMLVTSLLPASHFVVMFIARKNTWCFQMSGLAGRWHTVSGCRSLSRWLRSTPC